MIIDGPCKPLNPGESQTVRIIMSVHEGERLLNELLDGSVGPEVSAIKRGLLCVKKSQREDGLVDEVAKVLLSSHVDAANAVCVAAAIIREIDAQRAKPI